MKFKRQLQVAFALAIVACLSAQAFSQSSAKSRKAPVVVKDPITQNGLLEALRIGGLPPKALIQEIRRRGVAFQLTSQIEMELRGAGAKPAVIDAVRGNYRPFVGTLNVTSAVSGVAIIVQGVGNFVDRITDLKLTPGLYTVLARKLGYKSATRQVEIKFNQTAILELRPEEMTTEELLTLANDSFARSDYQTSVVLSRVILNRHPDQPKAIALLGSSLYMQGDYDEAANFLAKAVFAGESIAIPVLQRHGGSWSGKSLSPGRLIFKKESFEFHSVDFPDESFALPYSKVAETSIKDQMRLNLKVKVKLPKNRKESDVEYNLYSPDGVATGTIITCTQCLGKMRAVLALIMRFRSSG